MYRWYTCVPRGDPGTLGEAIRREVQAVDPGVPVFGIRTMDEVVGKNLAARRFAIHWRCFTGPCNCESAL